VNRINNLLLGIVLLSGIAVAGCAADRKPSGPGNSSAATTDSAPAPRTPVAVEVFEVKPATPAGEQLIPAVISTENTVVVLAQREGILVQLRAQEGARVAKGEELAQLNDDDLRAQLRQAELEANRVAVEERQYEALVKVSRSELEQEAVLFKEGLTSKRQLDRLQYKLEGAAQELEKARLATQTAQSRIEAVKVEIEKSVVRAPIAGITTHRYVKLGASVVRSDKLFEVAQLAPLEVRFQIPQAGRLRIGPGSLVNLSPADGDRIVARARVRRLDPVIDAASNSLGYLADVVGGAGLVPGSAVYVRLPREAAVTSLWIPRAAFPAKADLRRGLPSLLFVLEGDGVKARTVLVSAVEGDQVEISSGLIAGDRVILAPPAELKVGDVIAVVKN